MAWVAPLATAYTSTPLERWVERGQSRRAKARIGIVVHDFALGGTERIAVRLANQWSELGAEVEVFCGAPSGPLRDLLHPSIAVSSPAGPIARGRGSLRRLAQAARGHFEGKPVDAVYIPGNTHWPVVAALAELPAAKRPRIIAQVSAALEKPQRGKWRQRWFERRMRRRLRCADHVVGMCPVGARTARRILRRNDVTAIPLPALDNARPELRSAPDSAAPIVFTASRLVPGKGVETLVEAFAAVRHPTARLVIAGSGPNEAGLRALIARLGLEARVELLGYVPDIRPWLDRASFLAMPSEHEGYGAVIVEALSAGRPVLATDCSPAVTDLLGTAEAGLVVPICDVAAMAQGLEAMLARSAPNPATLASRVERFRIGPVARRYLNLVGIVPGGDGVPARLLTAANDRAAVRTDCVVGRPAL